MRIFFLKPHIINGALALIFCISCHFFMTAYTGYTVNYAKLELLRGQERSIKKTIKKLEQKNKIIERVNKFIDQATQSGLTKNQWDPFFVNLKEEPLSFLKLKTILTQTSNSQHYYFMPDSLMIKMGTMENNSTTEGPASEISQLSEANQSTSPVTDQPGSGVTISLKGHFLVKNRGADG